MTRIFMRAGKEPWERISAANAIRGGRSFYGNNVGNLLFGDAVHRLLSVPGVEIDIDRFATNRGVTKAEAARINDEYDHFVVPLANAFRPGFAGSLRHLAALIEKLDIPVTVVGVGNQLTLDNITWIPEGNVRDIQTRFLRAVLERSPAIGVRGHLTKEYIERLGVDGDQVEVVGCPSLYIRSNQPTVRNPEQPLAPDAPIALNSILGIPELGPIFDRALRQYADLTFIGQVDYELEMLLWDRHPGHDVPPGIPSSLDHDLYRTDRSRFFVDSRSWIDFLASRSFVVGGRLHGTIAGIAGGTPGHLICNSSRTLELAEYHAIPHTLSSDLTPDTTVAELHDRTDYTEFNRLASDRFERLTTFLEKAGLEHVAGPLGPDPARQERLDAMEPEPAVTTLNAADPAEREQLVRRRLGSLYERTEHSERSLAEHAAALAAQRRQIEQLQRLVKRQGGLIKQLEDAAESRSTVRRVADKLRSR